MTLTFQRLALVAALALLVATVGCNSSDTGAPGSVAGQAAIPAVALTDVDHVAWLSRQLPAETIGYFRLPLLWDLMSQPAGDALNNVKASAAHQAQIEKIRQGLLDNLWSELPEPAVAPVKLLLHHLTSPLEVAATLPPDGSLAPNFLIGATLALPDGQSFAELLDELLAIHPQVRRLSPEDDTGVSTVLAGPLPVYVHYDAPSQRLRMFTGASATVQYFRERLNDQPADNPVADWERPRDAAGRGLSLWMDLARLWPMVSPMMPPEAQEITSALGLDQMTALHAASVSNQGHGQLLVDLKMPRTGFRLLIPQPDAPINLKSAGTPDLVFRLALPGEREFAEGLAMLRAAVPDPTELDEGLAKAHTLFSESLGHDPALFLEAFGPQFVMVKDQSGSWSATQLKDQSVRDEIMQAWSGLSDMAIDQRTVNGEQYSYLRVVSGVFTPDFDEEPMPPATAHMLEVLGRLASHMFWTDRADQMVMSAVPQVLVERDALSPNVDLGTWLKESVGVDPQHSVLLVASSNNRGAREVYHIYLQVLLALADLAKVTIDPFELPVWQDVRQGEPGGVAFGMDASADGLSAHITYQSSVLEAMGGGQAFLAAYVAGIVAAIAVPAYQDFQTRTQVTVAMSSVSAARLAVSEAVAATGALPDSLDDADLVSLTPGAVIDYDGATGTLWVLFDDSAPAELANTELRYAPVLEDGQIVNWECSSASIPPRLLPGSCRALE